MFNTPYKLIQSDLSPLLYNTKLTYFAVLLSQYVDWLCFRKKSFLDFTLLFLSNHDLEKIHCIADLNNIETSNVSLFE